jgi:hypothetical protein
MIIGIDDEWSINEKILLFGIFTRLLFWFWKTKMREKREGIDMMWGREGSNMIGWRLCNTMEMDKNISYENILWVEWWVARLMGWDYADGLGEG